MSERLFGMDVFGEPAPQGSKRAFHHAKTGKIIMAESSAKVKPWRSMVASEASRIVGGRSDSFPVVGPLAMIVTYRLKRPKAHYKKNGELRPDAPVYVSKKPDLSKLQRSTEDALTGIVYVDDSQLVLMTIAKVYGEPGASISISKIEGEHGTEEA